jgi:predicted ArsR family transcriptional regulator
METSRQKILNYIAEQQCATVDELSKVFRVTPANIRHHLSVLTDQGSVKVVGTKAAAFRGRPSQIYIASRPESENNLESLTDILLSELGRDSRADVSEPVMKRIAENMVSQYQVDTSNPTRRLYSSVRVLNQMKYRAHWEEHIENPHIMLDHCPYRALTERHPEVCLLDKFILEAILSTPVEQIEKNIPNAKGFPRCVFILTRPL